MVEYDFIGNKTFYFLEDQQFRIYERDVWVIQLIYSLWKRDESLTSYTLNTNAWDFLLGKKNLVSYGVNILVLVDEILESCRNSSAQLR